MRLSCEAEKGELTANIEKISKCWWAARKRVQKVNVRPTQKASAPSPYIRMGTT